VGDAALLRALDGELAPAERVPSDAHLAACAACRARAAALAEDAALVRARLATDTAADAVAQFAWSDVVARAAPARPRARHARSGWAGARHSVSRAGRAERPVDGRLVGGQPVGGWRVGGARIAAGLMLAAGVAAAAPTLARWTRGTPAAARRPAPPPAARAAGPAVAPGPATAAPVTTIAFPLHGDTLRLAFDVPEPAGALDLRAVAPRDAGRDAGREVRVEVAAGAGGARLRVLPTGVRVRNAPASSARYGVTVPAHVRAVRVVIGTDTVETVGRAALTPAGVRVRLAPSALAPGAVAP
jgi:hypothetical protein